MVFSINQFIKYKIHIGHSYKNTKLLSSWILYKLQNDIWIVDIFKTIFFLKNLICFLKYLIMYSKPVWFINLELTKEFMFLLFSNLCGEFASTRYWVRGMLSNYLSISKSIKKYNLKKIVYKSSIFIKIISNWYVTRFTWPRAVLLANLDSNFIICNEANSSGIPIVGIIDSSSKSFLIKFPIISNDDSMESFYFIFNILSKLILLLKYKKLILWFFKYKKKIKEINLKFLFSKFYNIKKNNINNIFYPLNLFNMVNQNFKKIELYYKSKNIFLNNILSKVDIILFDLQLLKKKLFFNKYLKILKFRCIFKKNKLRFKVLKNIKNILLLSSFMNRKRKRGNRRLLSYKKKYLLFYWVMFVNLIKSLRVFYNSYILGKQNSYILYIKKKKKNNNYLCFPLFFFKIKKNRFYKDKKKNYIKYSNFVSNKLWINRRYYISYFIELYYNKWLIYLLNLNLY